MWIKCFNLFKGLKEVEEELERKGVTILKSKIIIPQGEYFVSLLKHLEEIFSSNVVVYSVTSDFLLEENINLLKKVLQKNKCSTTNTSDYIIVHNF